MNLNMSLKKAFLWSLGLKVGFSVLALLFSNQQLINLFAIALPLLVMFAYMRFGYLKVKDLSLPNKINYGDSGRDPKNTEQPL